MTAGGGDGCLRCLLLVMCTHPFAKKALTLHLARSEGHERYFGCNLMQRKVLASFHQHLMAEAPALNSSAGFNSPPWLDGGRHRPASSRNRLDAATGFEKDTGLAGTDRIVWSEKSQDCRHKQHKRHASATHLACRMF